MTKSELFEKIKTDENLKKDFINASKTKENFEDLLREHDCDATLDDFKKFFTENKSLSEQELKDVAGGCYNDELRNLFSFDTDNVESINSKKGNLDPGSVLKR